MCFCVYRWGAQPAEYDGGDTVQTTFLVVGAVMILWAALIFRVLRNEPPLAPAHPHSPRTKVLLAKVKSSPAPCLSPSRARGPFSSPAAERADEVPLLEDDWQVRWREAGSGFF